MIRAPRIRGWTHRLWWFDVVYPIAVALLMFSSLTYMVYSGQRSSRLSLLAEQKLLETSLTLGRGRDAEARGEVLVVSADALDAERLGRAPIGVAPEPDARAFAEVIATLARRGVKTMFVRWSMDAHPNDPAYYAPLLAVLKALPPDADVRFAMSSASVGATPPDFQAAARFVEDDTCNYPERLQSDCPFKPNWPEWVMEAIIAEALPRGGDAAPVWVTEQMPSIAPTYLMNLPDPESMPTQSFSSLLASGRSQEDARVAFVGTNLAHSVARADDTSVVRFVRTAYDSPELDFSVSGTPLHVFWAMTSQMFHDRAMVTVAPERVVLAMTLAFCLMVMAVMARFGATAASGMFLVYVVSGPAANAWAVRTLHVYAPLFDSFYFGLSTFLVGGFGRLSYGAFQRWRLAEQRRMHEHTADLKGNFISLLSHNLNTPVAKMQGMLGLLAAAPGAAAWRADVRRAEFYATQLEYAIRSVLVASAIEERSLTPTPRSLKAILEELEGTYGASLRRLGIDLAAAIDGDPDLAQLPVELDVRAVTASLAGLAALFADEGRTVPVTLKASVEDGDRGRRLHVALVSETGALPDAAAKILLDAAPITVRGLEGQAFFTDVLAGLGVLAARAYDGVVEVHRTAKQSIVELSFLETSSRTS